MMADPDGTSDRDDMQYAGFGPRLGAVIVDWLVLIPIRFTYWGLASISWEVAVVFSVPYIFAHAAYNVCFLARWGQTLGKRAYGINVLTFLATTCFSGLWLSCA